MKKRKKITISLSIDCDLLKKVDGLAFEARKTRSAVIKDALLNYINSQKVVEE